MDKEDEKDKKNFSSMNRIRMDQYGEENRVDQPDDENRLVRKVRIIGIDQKDD